jgi:autotransporter-associated beta strand protein
MITKPRLLTLAAALLSLVHVQTLDAQNLTWTTTPGGTITEGGGTWTTGSAGWWTGAANANWAASDNATFGGGTAGTAGTVTLGGNISANKIIFNAPFAGNYTLDLAGNTLTTPSVIGAITISTNTTTTISDSAGTGGWNINNAGTTQTISSSGLVTVNAKVTGTGNMYVGGTGSVILNNNANSFTGLLGRQNAGNLTISSIKNSGVASAAGAGTMVRVGASSIIIYNGSGDSTNRTLELFGIGSATLNNNGSGALVWTGPITHTSTANKTFTLGGSNTANNELQGALTDNGTNVLSVTKADAGTWVLSGNNSYNGLTTVSNGTLTLSGNNSGAGGVTITGGTLTLSGNNSGTGAVTLTGGTLNINSAAALGASASALNINGGTIDNTSGSAKTLVNNNPITLDGSFAYGTSAGTSANNLNLGTGAVNIGGGGRTITLNGAGALTFGGVLTNTNLGGSSLTVNNGTGTTSTTAVSFGGVSMTASGDGSTNRNFSFFGNGNVNITGAMVNGAGNGTTGALVWSNTGTLTLTGVNTYTGGTTINSGVLDAIDGTGLSSNSSLAIRGGVFQSSGNFTRSLGSLVNWSDNNGGFAARGGVLNLRFGNGTSSVTWGTAYNQVAGDGKSLIFGSSTADNRVDFQNGLNLGNGAVATRTITVIDNPDSSADIARISGNITETTAGMGLLKDGNGTLELTGNNSYTGTTTINAGTLQAAAANATGGSTVINVNAGSFQVTAANAVNDSAAINLNGGTLALDGSFSETVGVLTLSTNSTIDLGGFEGTLRFGGTGSWTSGANLAIWNWNGINQSVVFTDDSGLSSYLDRISFYSNNGTSFTGEAFAQPFSGAGGGTEILAVPEPETYAYALILITGVVVHYIRRRAKQNLLQGHRPA